MVIILYRSGFLTFFLNKSMVKSLFRHMVCSEMPNSCICGVCSSSSSILRAHLGVMGMGGVGSVLSEGFGKISSGIVGTSEHHSPPARFLFSCISDRPKSESCGVRSKSAGGGGPAEEWLASDSSWLSSSSLADLFSFSSASLSSASDSWSLAPV